MPLVTNDVVLLSWFGHCYGQRIILTHTLIVDGDFPGGETTAFQLNKIIDAVQPGALVQPISDAYRQCLPEDYTLSDIRCQKISNPRSAYQIQIVDLPGAHEGQCTVANDAAGITLRTDTAGRSQVATKHIGPIPDSASSQGLLTNAYRTLLGALGDLLVDDFNPYLASGKLRPCIVHKNALFPPSLITSHLVSVQSRVQRRRTVGLGE